MLLAVNPNQKRIQQFKIFLQMPLAAVQASSRTFPIKRLSEIRPRTSKSLTFRYPVIPCARFKRITTPIYMAGSIGIWAGEGDRCTGAFRRRVPVKGLSGSSAKELQALLNKMSKWIIAGVLTTILLLRHDEAALWAATGSLLNSGLSCLLKRTIKQQRPDAHLRSDPGMPSSHAQSLFYVATFLNLTLVERLGSNGVTTFLSGLCIAIASYFAWLRVSQHFHTVSQVLVGAMLGSFFSLMWFWSWDSVVLNAFTSHIWVKNIVILGAAGFSVYLVLFFVRNLVKEPIMIMSTSTK